VNDLTYFKAIPPLPVRLGSPVLATVAVLCPLVFLLNV
jgi:hypothetical protein